MMTDLFPDLGKPTIKSIEMSLQIAGGIEIGCSVPGALIVSPLLH
jgi:predicted cation transporter